MGAKSRLEIVREGLLSGAALSVWLLLFWRKDDQWSSFGVWISYRVLLVVILLVVAATLFRMIRAVFRNVSPAAATATALVLAVFVFALSSLAYNRSEGHRVAATPRSPLRT
jgi:hypothetical protein